MTTGSPPRTRVADSTPVVTTGCSSALEDIDLPALPANTWKLASAAIADNSDMTAIKCVGLNVATDNGGQTVSLDNIHGRGQATSILINPTNALGGQPIDITEPGDSNADGLADTDSVHTMIITYTDENQVVRDLYWTGTFLGDGDGDNLIESGEKVEITVGLKSLSNATPAVRDTRSQLELRPEDGGVLVVERSLPDNIDTVMNLN